MSNESTKLTRTRKCIQKFTVNYVDDKLILRKKNEDHLTSVNTLLGADQAKGE